VRDHRREYTELIIVDEADRLKTTALEVLRDFYDRTGIGVILIGRSRPARCRISVTTAAKIGRSLTASAPATSSPSASRIASASRTMRLTGAARRAAPPAHTTRRRPARPGPGRRPPRRTTPGAPPRPAVPARRPRSGSAARRGPCTGAAARPRPSPGGRQCCCSGTPTRPAAWATAGDWLYGYDVESTGKCSSPNSSRFRRDAAADISTGCAAPNAQPRGFGEIRPAGRLPPADRSSPTGRYVTRPQGISTNRCLRSRKSPRGWGAYAAVPKAVHHPEVWGWEHPWRWPQRC
jgi:hypothetical protein